MASDSDLLFERVTGYIQQLSLVAADLNKASDELGQAIAAIDSVLQSLSIGVPTWTTIESGDDVPEGSTYWSRDLGYAKVGKKWGISLRDVSGNYNWPDEENCDLWLFNEGPRWLRMQAVSKIPELLEALIKNTEETTRKIRGKTAEANQLAAVIAEAAGKKTVQALSPMETMIETAKTVAAGPTPTEITAAGAKNAVQETREQKHRKEKSFNTLALKAAAKELGKGKK
jgi:hypothetical protein